MKKKSLLILGASIIGLAGCGQNNGPKPGPEPEPCQHVDTNFDGKCDSCGETIGEPHTTHVDSNLDGKCDVCGAEVAIPISHQANFVSNIEAPSTTRDFRGDLDSMIEDFSGESILGTTDGVQSNSFLRVLVDSEADGVPNTEDASIYKMGTDHWNLPSYDGIGFKMRITGNKELKLSNLSLGLRGHDQAGLYEIKLSDALDPDGEKLPELTEEFQDVIVSPNNSIEDSGAKYPNRDGNGTYDLKVFQQIIGFHLHALDEECSAVVEISEVFLTKAGEKTVIDTFNRADVGNTKNGTENVCWWRGSTGFVVQKGVTLKDGKKYTSQALTAEQKEYGYIGLSVLGDTSGTKVNGVAWSELKDDQEAPVSAAVNGKFYTFAIASTLGDNIVIESTSEIVISKVFVTNLQSELPASEYPYLDTENALIFDEFNRVQTSYDPTYEAAIANTVVTESGMAFVIGYENGNNISVDGDVMKLAGNGNLFNIVEERAIDPTGMQYLVFKMKATDLSEFRIAMDNQVVWFKDAVADTGLKTVPANMATYPYVDNGFAYYILDIAKCGLVAKNQICIYYSGTEDVFIDSIFFANRYDGIVYNEVPATSGTTGDLTGWCGFGLPDIPAAARYMKLKTSSTDGGDLVSLRIFGKSEAWVNNGQIILKDGSQLTRANGNYIIDLVASGIKDEGVAQTNVWFHVGCFDAAVPASGHFDYEISYLIEQPKEIESLTFAASGTTGDITGWAGFTLPAIPADVRYMKLTTSSDNGADLASLRLEGSSGAQWQKDGALILKDGSALPAANGTYVIDLVASHIKNEGEEIATFWFHIGDWAGSTGTLNYEASWLRVTPVSDETEKLTPVTSGTTGDLTGWCGFGLGDIPAAVRYMKLTTSSTDGGDLVSLRIFGKNESWLNNGQIILKDGSPLPRENGTYVIDLVASGIKDEGVAQPGVWFHIGCFDAAVPASGHFNYEISWAAYEKNLNIKTKTAEFPEQNLADISGYNYAGQVQNIPANCNIVALKLSSTTAGQNLKSIRLEGADGLRWFNDGAVIDASGNAISPETEVTSEGITIYIDVVASGLKAAGQVGAFHIHVGEMFGSTGNLKINAEFGYIVGSYNYLMEYCISK